MEPVCGNGCREGEPCDSMAQQNDELTQQNEEQGQQTEEPTQQERTTEEGHPKAKRNDSTEALHRIEFCPDTDGTYTVAHAHAENRDSPFPVSQISTGGKNTMGGTTTLPNAESLHILRNVSRKRSEKHS